MISWKGFSGFFTTGLPPEVLYPSIILTVVAIVIGLLINSVKSKLRFVFWVIFVEYLFVLICSTVICRDVITFEFDRLELLPFWTYAAVINHTPGVSVWDIVLNVVLFMPFGFLVRLIYPKLEVLKVLLIAVFCSVFIETNQYVFEKGAAQIDDVIHNVIGAMIGWGIAWLCVQVYNKYKSSSNINP